MSEGQTLESFTPKGWKRARGYSHAIKAGGRLVIAGVLPVDAATQTVVVEGFSEQWRVALENLSFLVRDAGGEAESIALMRVYVTDLHAYRAATASLGEAWAATLGTHFPAVTLVEVSRLVDDKALLEIEAEAILEPRLPS